MPPWLVGSSKFQFVTYSPDWVPVVSGQFYLPSTLDMSLHALFSFKTPTPKLMWTSPVSMPLGTYDQVQNAHGSKISIYLFN
jgi:hypothetical protein